VAAETEDAKLAEVLAYGPKGALAVAAVSVAVVMAIWVAFYLFAFLPRGPIG
jgi:hypothetical protein